MCDCSGKKHGRSHLVCHVFKRQPLSHPLRNLRSILILFDPLHEIIDQHRPRACKRRESTWMLVTLRIPPQPIDNSVEKVRAWVGKCGSAGARECGSAPIGS